MFCLPRSPVGSLGRNRVKSGGWSWEPYMLGVPSGRGDSYLSSGREHTLGLGSGEEREVCGLQTPAAQTIMRILTAARSFFRVTPHTIRMLTRGFSCGLSRVPPAIPSPRECSTTTRAESIPLSTRTTLLLVVWGKTLWSLSFANKRCLPVRFFFFSILVLRLSPKSFDICNSSDKSKMTQFG